MKNLAGNNECDQYIQIELKKAKIPFEQMAKSTSEVPSSIIGKLNGWTFTRAWRYWIAISDKPMGLSVALKMHYKNYPDEMFDHDESLGIYGNSIRVGGHCGCPSPEEYRVTNVYHIDTQEGLNEFARVCAEQKPCTTKIN